MTDNRERKRVCFGFIWPDEVIIAWIRERGLIGPIAPKLIDDLAWEWMGIAIDKALRETGLFGTDKEGAQEFLDAFLSVDPKNPPAKDAPIAIVCRRAVEIAKEMHPAPTVG